MKMFNSFMCKVLSGFMVVVMLVSSISYRNVKADAFDMNEWMVLNAKSWIKTCNWMIAGVEDQINLIEEIFPMEINEETGEIKLTFESYIEFFANLPEEGMKDVLKDDDEASLKDYVNRVIDNKVSGKVSVDGFSVEECEDFEKKLHTEMPNKMKDYIKSNLQFLIALGELKSAKNGFEDIADGKVKDEEVYKEMAKSSLSAISACIVASKEVGMFNEEKEEGTPEEQIRELALDMAKDVALNFLGIEAEYETIKYVADCTARVISIAADSQVNELSKFLDPGNAKDWHKYPIDYINAVSNQYGKYKYKITSKHEVNISGYNEFARENLIENKDDDGNRVEVISNEILNLPVKKILQHAYEEKNINVVTFEDTQGIDVEGGAFERCKDLRIVNLKSEIIAHSLTPIITGCNNIEELNISRSVKKIPSFFMDSGAIEDLEIPEWIEEIGNSAFRNNKGLKSVLIPESVKKLGYDCFENCTNLESVNYNAVSAKISCTAAFNNCRSLKKFIIGKNVKDLPGYLIYGGGIEEITIPSNVKSIGGSAFQSCLNLKVVNYDAAYVKGGSGSIFDSCRNISDFNIGSNVKIIPSSLINSSSIKVLEIPEGVEEIGNNVFVCNRELTEVTIPKSLKKLGYFSFDDCQKLETVNYNAVSAVNTSSATFYNCLGIKKLNIGSDVEKIPNRLMYKCGIEEVTIPETVEDIGYAVFESCSKLKKINYDVASDKGDIIPIFYYCSNIEEINLGKNVIVIPQCFINSGKVKKLVIPDSVEEIRSSAFSGLKELEELTISGNLKTIERDNFNYYTADKKKRILDVKYLGSVDELNRLKIEFNNNSLDKTLFSF